MLKAELETLRLKKRQEYLKLLEVARLTEDLAEATDRRDEVSVRMLLSMRQELLLELQEMDSAVRESLLERPEEEAIRLGSLLNGSEPADADEEVFCEQLEKNRQLLTKITAMDKRINTRLGGKRSFYNNLR